jgi:hypothetical protein
MSLESEEEAIKHLYDQLAGSEYRPPAYWTNVRTFSKNYDIIKHDFVLDTALASPKGIEPLSPRS